MGDGYMCVCERIRGMYSNPHTHSVFFSTAFSLVTAPISRISTEIRKRSDRTRSPAEFRSKSDQFAAAIVPNSDRNPAELEVRPNHDRITVGPQPNCGRTAIEFRPNCDCGTSGLNSAEIRPNYDRDSTGFQRRSNGVGVP